MAEEIKDGTGTGSRQKVDLNNRAHTFSIIETESAEAAACGRAYNINTDTVALTGTGESGLLYFMNDEDTDFVVTAIAVGMGTRSITVTDAAEVVIYKNPTGGTLISDANAIAMKSNNNFGSSIALKTTTLVYSASATGKTVTGGTKHAVLYLSGTRLFATLDIEIPRGSSIALSMDLNTSGGANVYCALIGYVKDVNNADK